MRRGSELLDLVAPAGNRAVGRFVRSLQRVDYTKPVTNVEGSGITRLEVRDLRYGVDDFWKSYGGDASDERNKTKESPSHMAVVLVPDKLDLDQPVQVILHFHGWGFRTGDPYAGYLIAAAGSSAPAGTVRDVAQEHWEQQISSLKGQGAQVVAILAQGRGKSDFGSFPTFEYVRDVLEKSKLPELVKLAESENYSIVLSAHSGGGSMKVVPILGSGDADTAERSELKSQLPSKADGRVINKLQPVDLVVLYEALNGDGDVDAVMNWVDRQLTRIVPQLGQSPDTALAATPTLLRQAEGVWVPRALPVAGLPDPGSDRVARARGVPPGRRRSLPHHRGGGGEGRGRRARAGHQWHRRDECRLAGRLPARRAKPAERPRSGGDPG